MTELDELRERAERAERQRDTYGDTLQTAHEDRKRYADLADAEAALAKTLYEALQDADAELSHRPTSGGSDGVWCADHLDERWVVRDGVARCALAWRIADALSRYEAAHPEDPE